MRRLLLCLLLISCVHPYPQTPPDDRAAIDAAVHEYALLGRDVSKCDASKVQVYQPTAETYFVDVCDAYEVGKCHPPYRCAYSCFVAEPSFNSPTTGPSIVLASTLDHATRLSADVHESMHWLQLCSRGDADFDHKDLLVWKGALQRAQRSLTP